MRPSFVRRADRAVAAIVLLAFAACDDSVSPSRPDPDGLRTDLEAVAGALSSPTSVSFGALGSAMSIALGGGSQLTEPGTSALTLPPFAVGKVFVYDTLARRYVASARTGAPANGFRFVLYAVDTETDAVIVPLVETGFADFSRSVADGRERVRVEVFLAGDAPVKVIDYAAWKAGPELLPTLALAGWMRNASDSLTFALSTRFDLPREGLVLDWRTALPARGIVSQMKTTVLLGDESLSLDGSVRSHSGTLGLGGTLDLATGGTLIASINENPFAKLRLAGLGALDGFGDLDDLQPVFTRLDGSPLTPQSAQLIDDLLGWFAGGFTLFSALLNPMQVLLSEGFTLQ